MVRLSLQGVELMETGHSACRRNRTVPGMELRVGKHTMAEALERAEECDQKIARLLKISPLPEEPDYRSADAWLISAYQRAWGWG